MFKFKDDQETNKDLLKSVVKALGDADTRMVEDCIDNVRRLGNSQGNRPVLITFMAQRFKAIAFQHFKKFLNQGIVIANDLTKREQEEKKCMIKHQATSKSIGIESFLRDNKLKVDNRLYNLEKIQGMLCNDRQNVNKQVGSQGNRIDTKVNILSEGQSQAVTGSSISQGQKMITPSSRKRQASEKISTIEKRLRQQNNGSITDFLKPTVLKFGEEVVQENAKSS